MSVFTAPVIRAQPESREKQVLPFMFPKHAFQVWGFLHKLSIPKHLQKISLAMFKTCPGHTLILSHEFNSNMELLLLPTVYQLASVNLLITASW